MTLRPTRRRAPWALVPRAVGLLAPPLAWSAPAPPRAAISGELKQWHKVTLTLDGPFARERDTRANPFVGYRLTVRFAHESGIPVYDVPGHYRRVADWRPSVRSFQHV